MTTQDILREHPAKLPEADGSTEIVWGAGAIARIIGTNERRCHYLLEHGLIHAARKTGGRWHAGRAGLLKQFCGE